MRPEREVKAHVPIVAITPVPIEQPLGNHYSVNLSGEQTPVKTMYGGTLTP